MTKAKGPLYRVGFRRRREGVTDYSTRLSLLKSGYTRAVIRKTSRAVSIQFVTFDVKGDKVVVGASSSELSDFGFQGKCNIPSAYLVGVLAGQRGKAAGVKEAIADIGRQTSSKGNVLYAAVAGINDAGVKVPVSQEIVPSQDQISGKHAKSASQFDSAKQKILAAPTTKEGKK